jgi:hypothetical protein
MDRALAAPRRALRMSGEEGAWRERGGFPSCASLELFCPWRTALADRNHAGVEVEVSESRRKGQ